MAGSNKGGDIFYQRKSSDCNMEAENITIILSGSGTCKLHSLEFILYSPYSNFHRIFAKYLGI